MRRRFLIPSLVAAGFLPDHSALALPTGPKLDPIKELGPLFDVFKREHLYTLAGHRSHSSHSSHSSHRSSTTRGYSFVSPPPPAVQPIYDPLHRLKRRRVPAVNAYQPSLPDVSLTPTSPDPFDEIVSTPLQGADNGSAVTGEPQTLVSPDTNASKPKALVVLPGNAAKFQRIARDVQIALMTYGYFDGPITGTVGPKTRTALGRFQQDYGIKVTGTITPEVLDRLGITAN